MPLWLFALPIVACALIIFVGRSWPRSVHIGTGFVLIAIGLGAVAWLEWRYSADNTTPVSMPLSMSRAATVTTPPFRLALSGPYDVWLAFDHGDDTADFDCWTGYRGMEAECPRGEPALDIAWAVRASGGAVATGGTDWTTWLRLQATLSDAEMARARAKFLAYQARTADPSNRWPLYYAAGSFDGEAGRDYTFELTVRKPAGPLAALHPRLVVGLSASATKGLGLRVLVFAILSVLAGAGVILSALRLRAK